jgi:glycosyltransferase involved in cell wall biosynthesis
MRILYLHQYFAVPASAGGTRSFEMARRLVLSGHDVTMITSSAFLPAGWAGVKGWNEREVDGIHVHVLDMEYSNRTPILGRLTKFFRFAVAAAMRARRLEFDLVFATSTPLTIAIPGVWSARRRGVPLVFEVRDLWPEVPIAVGVLRSPLAIWAARRLEKWAYRNSSRVIALSPGMANGVAGAGFPADRITVIPNSCDLDIFDVPRQLGVDFRARHAWLGERPLVLYPGTLGYINGVGYLVDVAAEMWRIDPEIRFLIVGDGKEREAIVERARRFDVLETNFFLLPVMPKTELPAVFSAANMVLSLVIPVRALEDNSANKFFDGLAAGTAVGVNHGGWQADILRASGAGIELDSGSPAAAAVRLQRFLRDENALAAAGIAARQLATTMYSRDLMVKRLEAVLVAALRTDAES